MKNNYMLSERLLATGLLLVYSIGFYSCQKEIVSIQQVLDKDRAGEVLFRKGVLLQVDESDKAEVCNHIYPLLAKLDEMRAKVGDNKLFGAVNPVDQAIDDVINSIKNRDQNYFSNLQNNAERGDTFMVKEVLNKGQGYLNLYLEEVIPADVLKETQNGIEDLNREYLYKKAVLNEQDLLGFTKGINRLIESLEANHSSAAAAYAWWHWLVAAVVVVAVAVAGVATIVTTGGTAGVVVAGAALGTVYWILNWAADNHNRLANRID